MAELGHSTGQLGRRPATVPVSTIRGRFAAGMIALCLGLLALGISASSAFAERIYDSQITGFAGPFAVAIDPADNVWISDTGSGGLISEYSAYPSQTKIGEQSGDSKFGFGGIYIRSVALDGFNGELYVADSGPVVADVFEGGTGPFLEQWGEFGGGYVYLAVDNSGGASNGYVYVAFTPNSLEAFTPNHGTAAFSAAAEHPSYINGNRINGTPSGAFGEVRNVAVDGSGNIYVVDSGKHVVDEFASTGAFVRTFDGSGAPGGFSGGLTGVAVDPANEDVLVVDAGNKVVDEFDPSGEYLDQLTGTGPTETTPFGALEGGIAVNSSGYIYVADNGRGAVDIFSPGVKLPKVSYQKLSELGHTFGTLNATVELNEGGNVETCQFEYGTTTAYGQVVPCDQPLPYSATTPVSAKIEGLTSETAYHYRLVVSDANGTKRGADQSYTPTAVLGVTTGPATEVGANSMTLGGTYTGDGNDTQYYFEYGGDTSYGHSTPVVDNGPGEGVQTVSAEAVNLQSHFVYHFRLVAVNQFGTTYGQDEIAAETPEAPTVNGLAATDLTATTAILNANINPQGFPTQYHFEYGPTISYGSEVPIPSAEVEPANATTSQLVRVELTNLIPRVEYHFRLVASSKWGSVTTEDQTFNFFPPACPNENVRQQTQANYLPDCRAYELVSPSDAGGTQLYPGGPTSGYATSPSRFAFVGLWNTIPGSGGEPIDSDGDLYVATRTDSGWVTKYIGLPSSQAAKVGGPPQGPPGSSTGVLTGPGNGFNSQSAGLPEGPNSVQNGVLTDPSMDTFVQWDDGNQDAGDEKNLTPQASTAPYVFSAEGERLDRWPTNLASVPAGTHAHLGSDNEELLTEPGGERALDCPRIQQIPGGGFHEYAHNDCPGDVTASEDLSHFVFASEWNQFSPQGQLTAPGSVYDNNTTEDSIAVVSVLPNGQPIPSEPNDKAGDPLLIPAVSSDGSHILMAAGGTGPCGSETCPTPPCGASGGQTVRCPMQPSHLYMRVDGAVTYDVSGGHDVTYVGMQPNGSKVYFTSEERLVPQDLDESTDLYMWSAEKEAHGEPPLTLVSIGTQGEGNRDSCTASFTAKCGVVPYSGQSYCQLTSGRGGNCHSDNFIASQNGDIYFFSPEQLGGSHGTPNQDNLYDYRNGAVQYVTTLVPGEHCTEVDVAAFTSAACSNTPVVRMQVTPDDRFMAFVTASPVTGYDNAGHLEMYRYETASGKIICVSCRPDGEPPKANVEASQDGLFMTNDGRVFFSTEDPLVHADTNGGLDVYEYVDGRPQLITPGTGGGQSVPGDIQQQQGLLGVSADGTDAYFSTFETLVSQDHNGLFLKFYDARSGGGFSAPPGNPPCEAADECHGPGSSSPTALPAGSRSRLTPGNLPVKKRHGKRRRGARKHSRSRHAGRNRTGHR